MDRLSSWLSDHPPNGGPLVTEIAIVQNQADAGRIAADLIVAALSRRSDPTLGLATGSTPLPVWAALAERSSTSRPCGVSPSTSTWACPPDTPRATAPWSIATSSAPRTRPSLVRVPGDDEGPLAEAGERYEAAIAAAGGIDLQILGIGRTGHIGFNEPGSSLASRTRLKALTPATRADNARFFDSIDEVPTHCLTQGIGTILDAGVLVLLAFGEAKAPAVAAAVEGPLTSSCPASAIQLHRGPWSSSMRRPPLSSSTATTTASPGTTARSPRHDRRPAAHGARVVDARRDLPDAWVRVHNGLIAEVGTGLAPRASERIDLGGATLTPGLIDLHVHGGGGHAFDDGTDAITSGVAAHRRHGTTATLVSLVSSPLDVLRRQLTHVAVARRSDPRFWACISRALLSPARRGAHDPGALALPDGPVLDLVRDAEPASSGRSPSRPNSRSSRRDHGAHALGIRVAIGHTRPITPHARGDRAWRPPAHPRAQCDAAIGHRLPGPVAAALEDDPRHPRAILDGHVHVHPAVARMLLTSAPRRVALITDAMAAAATHADGAYRPGELESRLRTAALLLDDGVTIAGGRR